MKRDEVVEVIYEAIHRANELREPDDQIPCAEAVVLYGSEGYLDSLNLVSLILDVEQMVNERTDSQIVLADERAVAMRRNPFRDVSSLAEHVINRLEETQACPNPPSS